MVGRVGVGSSRKRGSTAYSNYKVAGEEVAEITAQVVVEAVEAVKGAVIAVVSTVTAEAAEVVCHWYWWQWL